jgi:hypothetical protein
VARAENQPGQNAHLRGQVAEGKSGDSQTLGTEVVLGEPGFDLGERGRRDPPAVEARRGESLFSPKYSVSSAEELYMTVTGV